MSPWVKWRREDGRSTDQKSFVSLRRGSMAFNAHFIRANNLSGFSRVTISLDVDRRRVGFSFHSDDTDQDSLALTSDGGSKGKGAKAIQVHSLMAKNSWLRAAAGVADKRARQYHPSKSDGMWVITIRPSFEVQVADRAEIPSDVSGIYRYLDNDAIVYIGRGQIRSRLAAQERESWSFDAIEYSVIEDSEQQAHWEAEWLDEYRSQHGFLPRYNRVGGTRP
jgi:hypothetical protein